MLQEHKYELGTVADVDVCIHMSGDAGVEVDLSGTCQLIVVGHIRGAAQEPLYVLSDLAVKYPENALDYSQEKIEYKYMATLVESGYAEGDLRPTGTVLPLKDTVEQWLDGHPRQEVYDCAERLGRLLSTIRLDRLFG